MRILYVANEWDYGDACCGQRSYEHHNFYESLVAMGHDVIYFEYKQIANKFGINNMNLGLESEATEGFHDLLFACFMYDEVSRELMRRISERIPTLLWLCDDHWRWDSFSCQWAPCFRWVATTASSALPKYAAMGYDHAIKTQWGAGPGYGKLEGPPIDVSFVGRPHGDRWAYIEPLRRAGINVQVWGPGNEGGRLTQEEMVSVFSRSRISLNFSESAQPGYRQIKGRHFEIPACGGFQLTNLPDDDLGEYFELGKEITTFESVPDLIDKVRYYLAHEDERADIANAGHLRTMRDHTYGRRFGEIFQRMGL